MAKTNTEKPTTREYGTEAIGFEFTNHQYYGPVSEYLSYMGRLTIFRNDHVYTIKDGSEILAVPSEKNKDCVSVCAIECSQKTITKLNSILEENN